jgi:Tol biopolymer transport system component
MAWRQGRSAIKPGADGRSTAYETDRTGNGDIYLTGADGHNKVQLTSSAASDTEPSWQPQ